ncbi:MAG TPA: single-stranded DNA-binding protein [Streptosporangiaceae bacterium]|jgi:single-strand DNA-binding protein
MFNEAHISLSGYVATQPALRETRSGIPSVTMRVAWTPRRMDRSTGEWIDAGTSFATVQMYRKLAENAATCLRKGDPVVVRGRVTVREFEARNGQQRTVVEIDAHSVGHDLTHGIATFHRIRPQTGMTAAEAQSAEDSGLSGPARGSAEAEADGDLGMSGRDEAEPGEPGAAGYVGDDTSAWRPAGQETAPGQEAVREGNGAGPEPGGTGSAQEPVGTGGGQDASEVAAGHDADGPDAGHEEAGDGSGTGPAKSGRRRPAREKALAGV